MLLNLFALASAIFFLFIESEIVRTIGVYLPQHTILHNLPYLLLSLYNPSCLCWLLLVANLLMDIEKVLPQEKYRHVGFLTGMGLYALFNFMNMEYHVLPFIMAYFGSHYIFRELNFKTENRLFQSYLFLLYANLISHLISLNFFGAFATICLATSHTYLVTHRYERPLPNHVSVATGLTYIHLFLEFF